MQATQKKSLHPNESKEWSDIGMSRFVSEHGSIVARQQCSVAQQDLTPRAINPSPLLDPLKITTSRHSPRKGDLETTMLASLEAEQSNSVAVDSLHVHVG